MACHQLWIASKMWLSVLKCFHKTILCAVELVIFLSWIVPSSDFFLRWKFSIGFLFYCIKWSSFMGSSQVYTKHWMLVLKREVYCQELSLIAMTLIYRNIKNKFSMKNLWPYKSLMHQFKWKLLKRTGLPVYSCNCLWQRKFTKEKKKCEQ